MFQTFDLLFPLRPHWGLVTISHIPHRTGDMYGMDGRGGGVTPKPVAALCRGLTLFDNEILRAAALSGGHPPKIFAGADAAAAGAALGG